MKEEAQLVTSFSQAERRKETTLQESKIFLALSSETKGLV